MARGDCRNCRRYQEGILYPSSQNSGGNCHAHSCHRQQWMKVSPCFNKCPTHSCFCCKYYKQKKGLDVNSTSTRVQPLGLNCHSREGLTSGSNLFPTHVPLYWIWFGWSLWQHLWGVFWGYFLFICLFSCRSRKLSAKREDKQLFFCVVPLGKAS